MKRPVKKLTRTEKERKMVSTLKHLGYEVSKRTVGPAKPDFVATNKKLNECGHFIFYSTVPSRDKLWTTAKKVRCTVPDCCRVAVLTINDEGELHFEDF